MSRSGQPPDLKKYMDKQLQIKLNANRTVVGTLRGFDQFMNLVIDNIVGKSTVKRKMKSAWWYVPCSSKTGQVKYEGFLEEKYGKERNKHPKFDKDLWSQAEGKNKGKVYGLGNDSDPCVHSREDPKIEKLNLVIKELVKEKNEEKERFNGIIAGLLADKEKIRWIKMRCLIGCHKLKLC
ncbi:uncharacterized protein LOC110894903 isoform X2 [Helianthus annuus]|uniref:uncharacterized protein LOC110894903 isoform X2 n=1 Tax=Helianthus annuus TaxID=4232 RepID=UPI000B8FC0B8|nr:uncharacterized protein LOC110894903 isoform X2 [Helianthus annuus]